MSDIEEGKVAAILVKDMSLLLMTIRTVSKYALRDEEDFIRRIISSTDVKQVNVDGYLPHAGEGHKPG